MEKESFDEARRQLVAKSNELIQNARQPLTKIQNEVIQYMVSKVKPDDKPGTEYTFKCSEFFGLMGYITTSYTDIKALLSVLRKINWWVDGQNGEDDKNLTWFDLVHANPNTETVTITFHKEIEPYIFQLREKEGFFSSYPFHYISLMKSFYSQKLYEQLNTHKYDQPKDGRKYPEWIYEIGTGSRHDLFRRIAQAAPELDQRIRWDRKTKKAKPITRYDGFEPGEPMIPESWKNYAIFKRDVLDPAVKEINTYTDMLVMYEPLKTDLAGNKYRRYTSIRFSWIVKSEGQIEDTEKFIDSEYQKREEARANHQYTLDELFGEQITPSLEEKMDKLKDEQELYEKTRKTEKENEVEIKRREKELREEEELDKRAEKSFYKLTVQLLGKDYNDDQLRFLSSAAFEHLPPGTVGIKDRDQWLSDYLYHYKKKVDATAEDTRTKPYNRLLDMVRNDYDMVGPMLAESYSKPDKSEMNSHPIVIETYESVEDRETIDDENAEKKAREYIERFENTKKGRW